MRKIPELNKKAVCVLKDNKFTYDEIEEILKMPIGRTSIITIYRNYQKREDLKVQEEAEEITSNTYEPSDSTVSDTVQMTKKFDNEEYERLKKMIILYYSQQNIKTEEDEIDKIAEKIKSIIPADKFDIEKVKATFIKMAEKDYSPSDFARLYNESNIKE